MKKSLSYIYIIFFLVNNSQAQMAIDTIKLPEVKLIESRITTHNIGIHIDVIKKDVLNEKINVDLASLVSSASSVYIKQYGALATPSFRGTSSSHTLVLWNGIPINSIANGLSDFSAIYCHNFSDIFIVNGGNASILGSGALGGSLHLNSYEKTDLSNELSFKSSQGSYGFTSNSFQLLINKGKLIIKGGLDILNHENNFEYINTSRLGSPLSINEYGRIQSNSQNLDLIYKLNERTNYSLNYWASNLEREVSQSMSVPTSDAKQYDISKRLLFTFKYKIDLLNIKLKQAYIQEDFRYTELLKNIDSHYIADSYISDVDIKLIKGNYLINIGTSIINNQIDNNNYTDFHKKEYSVAAFSALQYKSTYFAFNTVLRKEWQSNYDVPLIPMIALERMVFNSFKVRTKYNRNFRSPTYNDRFWIGSGATGNSNLKTEDAWNGEIGLDYNLKYLNLSITGYHLRISDMIVWQQLENGIWTPKNIKKVFSRGAESTLRIKFRNLSFNGKYAFTKSTSELAISSLDNTVGQQLRYVPMHKASVSLKIVKKNINIMLRKSYTGKVITSYATPSNKTLDSYLLTDFSIGYMRKFSPISLHAKIKNLMNKTYVTYQNYPNPGIEYLFTIEYIIN